MLSKGYLGFGLLGVALYSFMGLSGYDFLAPPRQRVPAEVRQAGGYRTWHFWHPGYRGGK